MRDMILKALRELDIPVYDISLEEERSAELFFIRKTLDMRRIKSAVRCSVTVYRDFEADGKKYRGRSVTQIFEGMGLDEIKARLKSALFAAQFVKNPFYELYPGKKEDGAFVAPLGEILDGGRPHTDITAAVGGVVRIVRADDVGTQLAGIVGILEHTGLTVGHMLPQRQIRVLRAGTQRRAH